MNYSFLRKITKLHYVTDTTGIPGLESFQIAEAKRVRSQFSRRFRRENGSSFTIEKFLR